MNGDEIMKGRRIVVTGAASGIGVACAKAIVAAGGQVVCMDLNDQALATVASGLGDKAHAVTVDITQEGPVSSAIAEAAAQMGGMDGLINSAGIVSLQSLQETALQTWQRMFAVNVEGTFLTCRAAYPWLAAAAGTAAIVNIASAQALMPVAGASAYAASKGAVLSFSKALAAELAPDIRVNCLCPGLIDTPMNHSLMPQADGAPPISLDRYALKRWGSADEIAAVAMFLLSQNASYMTGATVPVDGGRTFH